MTFSPNGSHIQQETAAPELKMWLRVPQPMALRPAMAKVLTWCAFLLRTWAQIEMCHPETGPCWQLEVLVVLKVVLACFAHICPFNACIELCFLNF